MTNQRAKKNLVILGGGYGGLACLRTLSKRVDSSRYAIRLLDASPCHTIKTRFHERAVLGSRDVLMRLSLRTLVEASRAEFVQDRVASLDFEARCVHGQRGRYDYHRLVIALGGNIAYFGVEGAAEHTVSLQNYADTAECAERLEALRIGKEGTPRRRVIVCGAGIEGLEVAGMLRQYARLQHLEVLVIERSGTLMARSQCGETQRKYLEQFLRRRHIDLRLESTIQRITVAGVELDTGERIDADLVYWCAGVRRAELEGLETGTPFRVNRYLQSVDHPDVFALGDFATVDSRDPFANLASAQRAVYHGEVVGRNLWRYEKLHPMRPARYRPIGEMIGLGDLDGVGDLYGISITGAVAGFSKKANEIRYLLELYRDLPRFVLRGLRALERV
jgi:NADH dehydrogenase